MSEKVKVGIEIGTNKSSIGVKYLDEAEIKIITNSLYEEIEPSIISIDDKEEVLVGENVFLNNFLKIENIITDIKRLIPLNFITNEKYFEEYKKYLAYDIKKENNELKVIINRKEYNIIDLLSLIFKQLIDNANEYGIIFHKIVLAVPSCFGIKERELIKKSIKKAMKKIKEANITMINETSASALAYISQINKKKLNLNYEFNISKIETDTGDNYNKLYENMLVFDLGAGCFNLTILSLKVGENGIMKFDIKANLGNPFIGGIDFDNKIMKHCITKFCQLNNKNEEDIYNNKNAIYQLKIRCEIAKIILTYKDEAIIFIKDFIPSYDLCQKITIQDFDYICREIYEEIENKTNKILKMTNISADDIHEILLIGGNTHIRKINQILNKKFKSEKIINNIDFNKIVVTGAALYACEIESLNKKLILKEVLASSLGLGIINDDATSYLKFGDKMSKMILKNTPISSLSIRNFELNFPENEIINIDIYEGDNKYVKLNKKLDSINIPIKNLANSNDDNININVTFSLNPYYVLDINIAIEEFNIEKKLTIGKIDNNNNNNYLIDNIKEENSFEIANKKKELKNYSIHFKDYENEDKIKVLNNCCAYCKEIIEIYEKIYYKHNNIIKLFYYTKQLFDFYSEIFKLKTNFKYIDKIILDIKNKMEIFIDVDLIDLLIDKAIKKMFNSNKIIYFSIILNYIELILEKKCKLNNNSNTQRHIAKIYIEKCQNLLSDEIDIYKELIERKKKIQNEIDKVKDSLHD